MTMTHMNMNEGCGCRFVWQLGNSRECQGDGAKRRFFTRLGEISSLSFHRGHPIAPKLAFLFLFFNW